jgi:excisionase family DNA binding protein
MATGGYLLRSKDAARILDLSPDDVVELVHQGQLRAKRVGRIWRYRLTDVMAYKREREQEREAA